MCLVLKSWSFATMLLLWDSLRGFGLSGGGGAVSLLPRSRSRTTVLISPLVQPWTRSSPKPVWSPCSMHTRPVPSPRDW